MLITARSETMEGSVFGAVSLWFFLFVFEISPELLNRFAPNSHGTCGWSLAWTSLKVKVTREKSDIFGHFGSLCVVYVW